MTLNAILHAREERVALQNELYRHYKTPMLVHRVNTPGGDKSTPSAFIVFDAVEEALNSVFAATTVYIHVMKTAEGPITIRMIDDTGIAVKRRTVEIEENHELGRFSDLDVYDENHEGVSRTALGKAPRTCYLCDRPAHECGRSRRHTLEAVLRYMERAADAYKS